MWLAATMLLVLAVAVVVATGLWGYAWLKLGGDRIAALDAELEPLGAGGVSPPGSTTVLVMLTEPHDPTHPEHPALAAGVALVQVGGPREGVAVVVLPDELQVTGDATLAALQLEGGVDAVLRAVVDYTGVGVDHVVSATTDALPELVEVRGAVEVCTATGCRELTGDAVRIAIAQGDDVDRVRTVAAVVRALALTVDPWDALLSPRATTRTIDVVADLVTTDVSLRGTGLLELGPALTEGSQLHIATLPAVRDPGTAELVVLPERAEATFQHLRVGTPLPVEVEPEAIPVGDVTVAVLNGTGTHGLAARVASRVEAEGFRVAGTGNAPPYGREETVVTYPRGDETVRIAAIMLVDALGAGTLEPLDVAPRFEGEPVDLLVTAGFDLEGLEPADPAEPGAGDDLGAGDRDEQE